MSEECPHAFVTLITSDSYLPGALALAAALRDVHPPTHHIPFHTVCLVTPQSIDVSTIKLLRRAFNLVIGVEAIAQQDNDNLKLLGRPDLHSVLTKLHVFRLTQYSKIIFLDADVLPIRSLSHLFKLHHEFSAVPDVGWPDIFNSGVMVLSPGEDKFNALRDLLKSKGSWDGGDQGILNEWRGDDWNRLSFTYNTTPTASYTYAPAYERYGSQISAVHFIGPNKPWQSISSRAPGSGSSQKSPDSSPQAYDYESLVDRWFTVYDKSYRSRPVVPKEDFEVQRYISAWHDPTSTVAKPPGPSAGSALNLEELKRLALEGLSATGLTPGEMSGEGGYRSLPLEGRVDLMPPRKEKAVEEQKREPVTPLKPLPGPSVSLIGTLPTPKPEEMPPTPQLRPLSLPMAVGPPTPLPDQSARLSSPPPPASESSSSPSPPPPRPQTPQRPTSPPLVSWNPAVEPPPTSTPYPSAFPGSTYYPNAWDQSREEDSQDDEQSSEVSDSLFRPPPPAEIPEPLLRQGHYRNVTGDSSLGSPSPDRTKVKPVFPWESRPRHLPGRVFPGTESPPLGSLFIQSPTASPHQVMASTATPSPLVGVPLSFSYANAWDSLPSIKKYASKLVKPSPPDQPLQPPFEGGGWSESYKRWADKMEAGSHDADDEDEGDESTGSLPMERARSSSISSCHTIRRGKREYKVRGVQTLRRETRNVGVQVTPALLWTAVQLEQPVRDKKYQQQRTMASGGGKRLWTPATESSVLPPVVATEDLTLEPDSMTVVSPIVGHSARPSVASLASIDEHSGMHSPRELSFSHESPAIQSIEQREPFATPRQSVAQKVLNSVDEKTSPSVTSPPSSIGPVSPEDGQPISTSRKVGRVWDPARGVELFKRGSEEVLARFLKMGWEEGVTHQV